MTATKISALLISAALSLPAAVADCPRGLPRIVGMDYHHARARLIVAGFRPAVPAPDALPDVHPSALSFGYPEGDISQGSAAGVFAWPGFTVHARHCDPDAPRGGPCTVTRLTCP